MKKLVVVMLKNQRILGNEVARGPECQTDHDRSKSVRMQTLDQIFAQRTKVSLHIMFGSMCC